MLLSFAIWNAVVVCALEAATLPVAPDTLVVCPADFRVALAPWESYRRSQSHELAVISPPATAQELHAAIRQAAGGGRLKFLVLIGDVSAVPTEYADAKINIRWGSERTIATDQLYADVDGDQVPDVAVGRIPADTPAELAAVVRKVLRYEQQADHGLWRRRVNVVAGVGDFGPLADTLIEAAGRRVIESTVPASFDVEQTFASPASPHCPPPGQFTSHVCRQLSEGSLAWIYLGHGLPAELDAVDTPAGPRPILSVDDVPQIRCGANSPLAVLIACYTGAIDAPTDCLAEQLLANEEGPVAVIAATRVTMPYGNTVLGCELLRACFSDRPVTLGELWTMAQRRTLAESPNDSLRPTLDALAEALSPPPADLVAERREHVLMYQLLGDPLLRLQYPHELTLASSPGAAGGESLTVEGRSDVAGECTVELVCEEGSSAGDAALAKAVKPVGTGPFRVALPLPENATGRYIVRAFVAGENDFAAGATGVIVERRPPERISRAANGRMLK